MTNANRDYGLDWERELVKAFSSLDIKAKRTPNSGAYGTLTGVSSLQGDVVFEVDGFRFVVEAKAGYGGSQSITLKREWIEKISEEAKNQVPERVPVLALKMKNSKTDSGKLICFLLKDFIKLLNRIIYLLKELEKAQEFIFKLGKNGVDISEYTSL